MFLGSSYSQNASEIRLGYIDTQTGNILDADMTTVLGTIEGEPIPYTDFSIAIDKGEYGIQFGDGIAGTTNAVIYTEYISSSSSKSYVAIEENGVWTKYELPSLGEAAGPGNANSGRFVDLTHYVINRNMTTHFSLELCELSEGSVASKEVLYTTPDSDIVATYQYYTDSYIVFQRGLYVTYMNFDTDAVIVPVSIT